MMTETVIWHWSFPGEIWGLTAAILLAVGLVWFAYGHTLRRVSPLWRGVLTAMRSLMLILVIGCLAGPQKVVTQSFKRDQHKPVAILVDGSGSMVRPDAKGQTRLDIAQRTLDRIWDPSGQMKLFTFADKLEPAADFGALKSITDPRRETHFLSSLRDALNAAPPDGWGAVVVLTDGNDSTAEAADETGRLFRERQTPLLLAATQTDLDQPDLFRLAGANLPAVNPVRTEYPLDVFVRSETTSARNATVRVLQDNQTVMESKVTLQAGPRTQKLTFHFTEQTPGPRDYRVQLFDEGRTDPADQLDLSTQIVDKQRVRALYYAGSLSVEYRFVRAALARNPSIELEGAVHVTATSLRRQVLFGNDSRTSQDAENFPKTAEELGQYDVIVLADLMPSQLDEAQVNALLDYVKGGGGLIFLVSNSAVASDFSGSQLEQLLPVVFEPKPGDAGSATTANANPTAAERLLRQLQELGGVSDNDDPESRDGADHSTVVSLLTMNFTPDGQAALGSLSSDPLERAPKFREYAMVQRAKPGAIVAAEHPRDGNAWGKRPLLAMQRFGQGRSAVLATDSIWRWQLSLPSGSHAYEKLWQQMLLWVAHTGSGAPEIEAPNQRVGVGEKVPIAVKLPPRSPLVAASQIMLTASAPDGTMTTIPLSTSETPGTYTGSFTVTGGPSVHLQASVGDLNPGRAVLNVRPANESLEDEHLALDLPSLRRLAAAAGGQVVNAATLGQLPPFGAETEDAVAEKKVSDLWDNGLVFAMILGLFCVELILRRWLKLL